MSNPPIPKLPGYTVCMPQSIADKSFKKGQTLNFRNGYQREEPVRVVGELAPTDTKRSAAPGELSATQQLAAVTSATASLGTTLPQWVENDRKVLRFYGYFKETVNESNMENHRIRRVILYYYLEDDSMHVAEPRQDNSGIPQGIFIKRHKFSKDSGELYSPADFKVGETVTMYARTFHLVDCDEFTREFYAANASYQQAAALPYPDDPINEFRDTFNLSQKRVARGPPNPRSDDFARFVEAKLGKPPHVLEPDRLKQFLDNNRKVLRFWCVWDDRTSMYGDRRPYVLHYFLEDDTVEILEVNEQNSGRDPFPIFLRRAPLPKVGLRNQSTVGVRPPKSKCYAPGDFRLGTYLTVHNRDFFIHDCDGFTKQWYQENLGYTEGELGAVDIAEPIIPFSKPAVPPYNGYGTLEDSMQNCLSLTPKPPKKDMHKLMNKDKIILRFVVRLIDTDKYKLSHADVDRRYVLSYFMMDDTILVFEPPVRNSGIVGGKFLERQRVYKPNTEDLYNYTDLFVGAKVEMFNRGYELLDADEYTLTYMENNKHAFIMADADAILKSLRQQVVGKEQEVRTSFIEMDTNGSGQLSGEELEEALLKAGLRFTRHQIIALRRRIDKDKSGQVSIEEFLSFLGFKTGMRAAPPMRA